MLHASKCLPHLLSTSEITHPGQGRRYLICKEGKVEIQESLGREPVALVLSRCKCLIADPVQVGRGHGTVDRAWIGEIR